MAVPAGVYVMGCGIACARSSTPPSRCFAMRRERGIPVMSGSDTGNASAFSHGRWHGKEAELFVKEVGMPPMEAIVANTSRNA